MEGEALRLAPHCGARGALLPPGEEIKGQGLPGAGEKFADFPHKFPLADSCLGHASEKACDLGSPPKHTACPWILFSGSAPGETQTRAELASEDASHKPQGQARDVASECLRSQLGTVL